MNLRQTSQTYSGTENGGFIYNLYMDSQPLYALDFLLLGIKKFHDYSALACCSFPFCNHFHRGFSHRCARCTRQHTCDRMNVTVSPRVRHHSHCSQRHPARTRQLRQILHEHRQGICTRCTASCRQTGHMCHHVI